MQDIAKKHQEIISKCWTDVAFKQRLLADPAETLKAEGVQLPEGLTVKAVENTAHVFYLVIPDNPTELSDDQLSDIAGGKAAACVCVSFGDMYPKPAG